MAKYMYADDVWDQLQFTLREGAKPRTYVATTPRSIPLVKDLLNLKDTMVSSGSTAAHSMNLAPIFIAEVYA